MIYFFYFFCVEEWKEQRERKSNYRSGLIQFKLLSTTDEFTFSIYLLLSLSHTLSLSLSLSPSHTHTLSLSLSYFLGGLEQKRYLRWDEIKVSVRNEVVHPTEKRFKNANLLYTMLCYYPYIV